MCYRPSYSIKSIRADTKNDMNIRTSVCSSWTLKMFFHYPEVQWSAWISSLWRWEYILMGADGRLIVKEWPVGTNLSSQPESNKLSHKLCRWHFNINGLLAGYTLLPAHGHLFHGHHKRYLLEIVKECNCNIKNSWHNYRPRSHSFKKAFCNDLRRFKSFNKEFSFLCSE